MKKHILTSAAFIIIVMFTSCKPVLSGKDDASFKASKAKLEASLSPTEKTDLEKALRVIVIKAMKEKFNHPDDYQGKSFDQISLKMVDGKSFSGLVHDAEDFLREDNEEKKSQLKAEIDTLNKHKAAFEKTVGEINEVKLTDIAIGQDEFFDEMVPFLQCTFTNTTNTSIIGAYMFHIDIFSKSTGKLIASQEQGGSFREGYEVLPNETYDYNQPLLEEAKVHSKDLWKTAKYPIKDFAPFDLVINIYPIKVTTKNGTLERPEDPHFDQQIAELEGQLKELEKTKGTLDELELDK